MLKPPNLDNCYEVGCGFINAPGGSLDPGACRVISDLTLLFEISQTLEESLELPRILRRALKLMSASMSLRQAAVTIVNRDTEELVVNEPAETDKSDPGPRPGHELLRWVIETGKPVTVANTANDAHFQDRKLAPAPPAGRPQVVSFLCVPIRSGRRILGTLSVERASGPGENFDRDLRMLAIIASVIAQAVSLRQLAQERIAALREENDRLQEQIRNHFKPANMVGRSSAMQSVYNHIESSSAARAASERNSSLRRSTREALATPKPL